MRGLLMKDLELIKINMKIYLAVFLIGIIYLVAQENGSTFFVAYAIFCEYWCLCRNKFPMMVTIME